jgi:hypothetical protein
MCSLRVRCCLVATLSMLGLLTCAAQEGINGEATYIPFSVPGALGTYPMSINASMTVTGYYYISSTTTGGFVREADGTITTFSVPGSLWTEPESINAAGDIVGFFELVAGVPHSFLRYADGHIVRFDPPCSAGPPCNLSVPVGINAFGEVVGNYPFLAAGAPAGFSRSRAGVFTMIRSNLGADYGTVATGIDASGSVVGHWTNSSGEEVGFLSHPDGFWEPFAVPLAADQINCISATIPDSINAAGTIAGWYLTYTDSCSTKITGGFVLSPDGVFTLFQPPGTLVTLPSFDYTSTAPHWISIDQARDITGSYKDTDGAQHGFVRNSWGTITSFDPPRGGQTTPSSINDSGVIAGSYFYDWNTQIAQGFLRVPHP